MANKEETSINFESGEYQFKDFGDVPLSAGLNKPEEVVEQSFGYQMPADANDDDVDSSAQSKLLSDGDGGGVSGDRASGSPPSRFWTFEYYQSMFDVDTRQVVGRILGSALPRLGVNYLQENIRPKPDLYGPVWVSVTLVFLIAIGGNIVNYFHYEGVETHGWHYDFNKVSISASIILAYTFLVPCLIYMLLWWRGNPANYTLLETVCVYGYCLSIFVPISILWLIQYSWLQWSLVVIGSVMSGSVLVLTFYPAVSHLDKKVAVLILLLMVLLHASLASGFMFFFFHVPMYHHDADSDSVNATTTSAHITTSTATAATALTTLLTATSHG